MTAPVLTIQTHSYWCEGCDCSYDGEPNEGYALPRGIYSDSDQMIFEDKVNIGTPVKYCGQEDDDVCILEDGENWSWNECPIYTCGSCGKEFAADTDQCTMHDYSSSDDALRDASQCCSTAVPEAPAPVPEVAMAVGVTTQRFKAGDVVQITTDKPNNAGFMTGDLMSIDHVQVIDESDPLRGVKYYGTKANETSPMWFVQARYVKQPDPTDMSLDEKFHRKPAPPKKRIELDV